MTSSARHAATRCTATLVLSVGALLSATACSPSPVVTATSAGGAPSISAAAPTPAPTPVAVARTVDRAPTAPRLIDERDLGPGYRRGADPEADPDASTVCGTASIVAQFPDAQRSGTSWDGPQSTAVIETVSVYPDQETSDAAVAATHDGLSCDQGTVGSAPVVVTPREDLRVDVGGDQASGWRVGGDRFDAVYIVVQSGRTVATFAFIAPTDVDTTALPDPLAVARRGVQHLE